MKGTLRVSLLTVSFVAVALCPIHAVRVIDPDGQDGTTFAELTKPAPQSFEVGPAVRLEVHGLSPVGTIAQRIEGTAGAVSGTVIALEENESCAKYILTAKHVAREAAAVAPIQIWRASQWNTSGEKMTREIVSAWVLPGGDLFEDLAVLRQKGCGESFAVVAAAEPSVGDEFSFAGAGFAGWENYDPFYCVDLGTGDDDDEHDKGLDTRMGILRRGDNVLSQRLDLPEFGRIMRFDLDLAGIDPLHDGQGPIENEAVLCSFDSGTGYLVQGAADPGEPPPPPRIFGVHSFVDDLDTGGTEQVASGPSVAHYRAWIERTIELDETFHDLRAEVLALIAAVEHPGNVDSIIEKLDSGFAALYASEGAIAHVSFDVPEPADSLSAKLFLRAKAMNRWQAGIARIAEDPTAGELLRKLADFAVEIGDASSDEVSTSLAERRVELGARALEAARAALERGRYVRAFNRLHNAHAHFSEAAASADAESSGIAIEIGAKGSGGSVSEREVQHLEVTPGLNCAVQFDARLEIGCQDFVLSPGGTFGLTSGVEECEVTLTPESSVDIQSSMAVLRLTAADGECEVPKSLFVNLFPGGLDETGSLSFLRGDPNADGSVDVSDAVFILNGLFLGSELPKCADAADANDDGEVDISDGIRLLSFLFLGTSQPASPFPDSGFDLTDDGLRCEGNFEWDVEFPGRAATL